MVEANSQSPATVLDEPDWIAELEAERRHERRMLWMNMAFSAVFHSVLMIALFLFVHTPPGRTEGLTEIQLSADIPRLGDEDAPDNDGVPSKEDTPKADDKQLQPQDMSLEEKREQIEKELDAEKARQEAELAKERAKSAAATKASEAARVKGVRSTDARVGGALAGRAGIGGLEPRTFYGMKVHSRKMVFVLDVSGSMNIPYAKLNLRNAYRTLGPKEKFAIVCYDNRIFHWPESKRLVYATKANKALADRWINTVQGGGATNIYDALRMAFEISHGGESADTFYFLSDGFPTYGIKDSGMILDAALKWNKRETVLIHTIGLGQHDVQLMRTLAKQHRGKYKALR